jgi:SAM-dependent methyltransferase
LRKLIPRSLRLLAWSLLFRSASAISRLGERLGAAWLIYNPLLFLWFHLCGVAVAPTVYAGFSEVFPNARRYADVGAGTGAMAAHGRRLGLEVEACEHSAVARWFARAQGVSCVEFDLTRSHPAAIGSDFDVAYCFEVGEHLPTSLSDTLAQFVAAKARWIVFSAAQPGQGGHGHINEQPPSYWIDRFRAAGCQYEPDRTEALRRRFRADTDPGHWLVENVLVFAGGPRRPSS